MRAIKGRTAPTAVLLTARALGGWWAMTFAKEMTDSGHPHTTLALELPDRHPRPAGVFRIAFRAFASHAPGGAELSPPAGRWTTLDLVMLAWLAAHNDSDLPDTTAAL